MEKINALGFKSKKFNKHIEKFSKKFNNKKIKTKSIKNKKTRKEKFKQRRMRTPKFLSLADIFNLKNFR